MKYCSKCGKQLEDNAKFCDNCGTPASNQNTYNSGSGEQDGNGKKTIILLAVALAVVVVICAVVLIVFAMKNSNEETVEVTTATETVAATQAPDNSADNARYKSLLERFNKAKLKAAKKGVKVKKQKNAAKEALDQYKGAIDSNDTTLMSKYADDAEKYVSKLESASNKSKKKVKKGAASVPQQKVRSQYNVPESEKTNYRVAPNSSVGEYYFDDILDDDVDRYAATTLAINEYYARHGCQFQTPALQKYFEHQKWYTNLGKSTASVALTGTEAHNAKRLQKDREWYKKNMSGASGQASDFSYEDYMDIGRAVG